jgi:hypothetical protein
MVAFGLHTGGGEMIESSGVSGIDAWLAALDIAEALRPATIIAGHKDPHAQDDPSQIQATRGYLTDARRLLATSESAEAFYRDMLALHPSPTEPRRALGWRTSTVPVDVTSRCTPGEPTGLVVVCNYILPD